MSRPELAHLQLLAQVDSLLAELQGWASAAPDWPVARTCEALVKRLATRVDTLRVRLDAPLVVATLGGTGTGKSSLVNALVGSVVTTPGRQRPTTRQPVLICRPDITPESLGIDPSAVRVVQRESPLLRDMVLIDCPDPDTTEEPQAPQSNLAQLHRLLPHCDVLLVTTTQQKYRSAVISEELAAAAVGARLVFVETHADIDDDVRDDWRRLLAPEYATGEMFFIDSLAALRDAEAGYAPRGEFGRLVDLLVRELAPAAGHRIRRANFLDLMEETLATCREAIDAGLPAVRQVETAIGEQRARLATGLARQLNAELTASRRPWENHLLAEVASRWGFSPFALLLRAYQGLGGLISGTALFRVRTTAQLALWGLWEGGRQVRNRLQNRKAQRAVARLAQFPGEEAELRTAAIIVDGYAAEAGLPREETQLAVISRQAEAVAQQFVARAAGEVQSLIARLAARHTGWFTRWRYEILLLAMIGLLAYRFGRNFFYDSWLAPELGLTPAGQPLLGVDFFIGAGLSLFLWCGILLWAFSWRLRRGLRAEIVGLDERLANGALTTELFHGLEARCQEIVSWRGDLERLELRTAALGDRLNSPEMRLGHRIS